MNKLTEAQLSERRQKVVEALESNPDLTMSHFKQKYGYSPKWLNSLGLKFGKYRPDPGKFGSTANR